MNYEAFALDYAEGRLAGEELAAMEAFLSTRRWSAVVMLASRLLQTMINMM